MPKRKPCRQESIGPLIGIAEVAFILGRKVGTIERLIAKGGFPPFIRKSGGDNGERLWRRTDIYQYLEDEFKRHT